jgi:hypothetical protein
MSARDWWTKFRGYLHITRHSRKKHHFFNGSYSNAQMKIEELKIILKNLSTDPHNASSEKQELLNDCDKWLKYATHQIDNSLPQLPFGYDGTYAALHKIRNHLCMLLPVEKLLTISSEIESEVGYVSNDKTRQKIMKTLNEFNSSTNHILLEQKPQSSINHDKGRLDLQHISMLVGQSREAIWHKVNLLRTRLLYTLIGLIILLLISIPVLDYSLSQLNGYQIFGFQLLGAIGGAVSAIRIQEKIDQRSTQYYLKQTLLYLRPAVGAVAGLALALAQLSGIITFFPNADPYYRTSLIMFIAFLGGFSERFFLKKVVQSVENKLITNEKNHDVSSIDT